MNDRKAYITELLAACAAKDEKILALEAELKSKTAGENEYRLQAEKVQRLSAIWDATFRDPVGAGALSGKGKE